MSEKPTEKSFDDAIQDNLDMNKATQDRLGFEQAADDAIAIQARRSSQDIMEEKPTKKKSKKMLAAGTALFLAGGAAGYAAHEAINQPEKEPLDVVWFHIPQGGNIINAATEELNYWAQQKNIDPANIPNLTYAGHEATAEYSDIHGTPNVQAGDRFTMKIFGDETSIYEVDIDPMDKTAD